MDSAVAGLCADSPRLFARHLERLLGGELHAKVVFQPIVDLCGGAVTGYEALTRFPKEFAGPPDACFRQAGWAGRREDLEQIVCRRALAARPFLPDNCFLSINLGPEFLLSSQWQEVLEDVADLAGVVIEITEETAIADYETTRQRVAQIRRLGGSVAVDDAGSGYASLHHILEMKPDFIKLDRHFIENCHLDRAKSTLIEMMGAAANRLDAWIIAEGVETMPEMGELIRIGVPLAQGFLLGRPAVGMLDLCPAARSAIQLRNLPGQVSQRLAAQIDACPQCRSSDEAMRWLVDEPGQNLAVVTDQWGRPARMLERHSLIGLRWIDQLMRVQAGSDPAEVLRRALTRDSATRFDPITVIDPEGQFLGVLSVDRLAASSLGRDEASREIRVH